MAPAERPERTIRVEVVYCPAPGQIDHSPLELTDRSTVSDALAASGLLTRHGSLAGDLRVGVWCKVRPLATVLRDGDRVEVYRPLTVDPKEARRQRYKGQRQKPEKTGAS